MGAASFEAVRTTQWWWLHQRTQGIKPLPVGKSTPRESQSQGSFAEVRPKGDLLATRRALP